MQASQLWTATSDPQAGSGIRTHMSMMSCKAPVSSECAMWLPREEARSHESDVGRFEDYQWLPGANQILGKTISITPR
jgi:hypothetical protein